MNKPTPKFYQRDGKIYQGNWKFGNYNQKGAANELQNAEMSYKSHVKFVKELQISNIWGGKELQIPKFSTKGAAKFM